MPLVEFYSSYSETPGNRLDPKIAHSVDINSTKQQYVGLSFPSW